MKKKLFALSLIITAITVMLLLISCSDNDINSTDNSADKHASSEISKTENTVNNGQTAIQTEPSTETQTDITIGDVSNTASDENGETSSDPAANDTISLNMELISDYGLTFDELLAKYGKVTHFASPKGGTCYKFERGYGFYCCGDVSRIVDWVYDDSVHCENGGSRKNCYAVIDGDTTCYSIDQITASDLFSESFTSLTIEEISKIPGISYIKTSESDFEQGVYSSSFKYDGFSHKNGTEIFIEHYDKNEITPTSEVEIFTRAPYN